MDVNEMNSTFEKNTSSNSSLIQTGFTAKLIREPYPLTVIRLTLFAILFVTAIVGNACVFLAPWRNARLRTFSYSLITCLAIGDFVSALGLPFILITEHLSSNWIFGQFLCQCLNPTQVVCGMVTTNVHTAISVDRYISVAYPFKGKPKRSRKWLIFLAIWLTAILCALPAFIARKLFEIQLPHRTVNICIEIYSSPNAQHIYSVFLFSVNYLIPILVMAVLYSRIMLLIRSVKHRRRKSTPSYLSDESPCYTGYERKFIRMNIVVMLLFVLCYLPYQVFFLLMEFGIARRWKFAYLAFDYVFFVTWLPNALSPIFYGAMDRAYARAFKVLFRTITRRLSKRKPLDSTDVDVFVKSN